MDICGITSIIVVFTVGHHFSENTTLFFLIFGLFCVFYRGIGSLCIINEKFRIIIKLLKNSIIDMVPFMGILVVQILMFATLNSVTKISELTYS